MRTSTRPFVNGKIVLEVIRAAPQHASKRGRRAGKGSNLDFEKAEKGSRGVKLSWPSRCVPSPSRRSWQSGTDRSGEGGERERERSVRFKISIWGRPTPAPPSPSPQRTYWTDHRLRPKRPVFLACSRECGAAHHNHGQHRYRDQFINI